MIYKRCGKNQVLSFMIILDFFRISYKENIEKQKETTNIEIKEVIQETANIEMNIHQV